ncbi:GIY-YIG nuclease family protein [Nocardioides terrigena]|uniref:GIY-YIG nuclease family protein n=1 Tax=Nocardioides terrigena TaxID=424797 RepID=UPI000D2F5C86|nr:GIY-YIG nuclease family protein [Nocardioides terrigena]
MSGGVLSPRSAAHFRLKDKPHYVYQFWSDTTCLYVGCTAQPAGRIASHASKQPWWRKVTHFSADVHPDKETGLIAEAALIHELQPEWNWLHTEKVALGRRA